MNNKPGLSQLWNDVSTSGIEIVINLIENPITLKHHKTSDYYFDAYCKYLAVAIAMLLKNGGLSKFQERVLWNVNYKKALQMMHWENPSARTIDLYDVTKL
jgi:hypothetical protein